MSTAVKPVVRIAPSPTGMPHVGLYHTFLYNWLFARHHGGRFIIRIEDTDRERYVEGAVEALLDGVRWLGLDWDEGPEVGGPHAPYFQSQRLPLYQQATETLIASGHAYYCYCSPERLAAMRAEQLERKQPPGYDRRCRTLTAAERAKAAASGVKPVVRFAMPLEGTTTFDDLLRGPISFENRLLDDFVILKSDGFPTYHLAHMVDDHVMGVTHVLRGEEWIPSTPRHLQLYRAFGWEPPQFAHLAPLLGPDHKKLSKRHGAMPIAEYRNQGFLPEAMVNYLAITGWSLDGVREIFTLDELVRYFTLERVNVTGAIFDLVKLESMNGIYIRALPPAELARRVLPFLGEAGLATADDLPYIERILTEAEQQTRLKRLAEAPDAMSFFFSDALEYDSALLVPKGMDAAASLRALQIVQARLRGLAAFDAATLEGTIRPLCEELGHSPKQLFGMLRVAVTGRTVAPPLFQTMAVLGQRRVMARLAAAEARLREARGVAVA